MSSSYFCWERFWVPRGTALNLSEGAYLPDPNDEWNAPLNPGAVPTAYFEERPCVVLLGDAAMGKSTAVMEVERAAIDARLVSSGGEAWREPLGRFSSESLLVEDVFRSAKFKELGQRDRPLHLYLDDFDECLLRVPTLPEHLIHELKRFPAQLIQRNLRLRILCRGSVWPDALTAKLMEIWGDSGVEVFELAPLRLKDIRQAAAASSLNPEAFIAQVRRFGVSGFASRPLTLKTLLTRFDRDEAFPTSPHELFRDACLDLCAAYDHREFGQDRSTRLTPTDRLAVAGRVAAAAMFSGREFVNRQWTASDESAGAISLQELTGKEVLNGRELSVGEIELDEVLQTGLFTEASAYSGIRRWAHRSYMEYLAADYLARRNLSLDQVRSLIVHPSDPDGRLIPPLHETAAWLAGRRDDVFEDLLSRDPSVLLSSDVVGIGSQFRARLIDALLTRYDAGDLLEPDWATRDRFRNLAHPELGQQLRPWIPHPSRRRIARTVAIDIAERCQESSVLDALIQVALDATDDVYVRIDAAAAVAKYGDEGSKAALKPLIAGDTNDPVEELKGYALEATWPLHLSATELFEVLTPPRPNFFGAYQLFLNRDPLNDLERDDLPIALTWAAQHLGPGELPYGLEDLVESLMRQAVRALENPDVAELFGALAWRHFSSQHRFLDWTSAETFRGDGGGSDLTDANRRDIVTRLVEAAPANQEQARKLAGVPPVWWTVGH